jgi:hypothetical protein
MNSEESTNEEKPILVSQEMMEAGARVLEEWYEYLLAEALVTKIYTEMERMRK